MVLEISVDVLKSIVEEDCHFSIVPVVPDKIKVPELLPVQTVVLPEMVPPLLTALMVTVALPERSEAFALQWASVTEVTV